MQNPGIDIIIDKLTDSIQNRITGEAYKTDIARIIAYNSTYIAPAEWLFDWKAEFRFTTREIYKITTLKNPDTIQGLISLEVKEDHVFIHLVESARFNRGADRMYEGVAGNLFALACKVAFDKGFEGYVAFNAKTPLIEHYRRWLGASQIGRQLMMIGENAATVLVNRYLKEK